MESNYKHLSVFIPDERKVLDLADKLKNQWAYLSDEYRNDEMITAIILSHLAGPDERMLFEIGDWHGLFGLVNVIPGWKADLFFKIWDKSIWGPDLEREIFDAMGKACDLFNLERVSLSTPDNHTIKIAKAYGFEQEGVLRNSFKWGGVSYDTIYLGLDRRK
jgi:RimJ/RimL family protein N-acetyltransferase